MELFISWSGEKSKYVATILKTWLPDVIQKISPWVSYLDINAGARWSNAIQERLASIKFGIICITQENATAPWILFEMGALAKALDNTFVCPYLIDMGLSDIPSGPITQFQAKSTTKEGTWDLICSINTALDKSRLPDDQLKRAFERCWPELGKRLSELPEYDSEAPTVSQGDKIDEILETVRELKRLPMKALYILDTEPGIDLNAIASFHDVPKNNPKFQQKSGRVKRVRNNGNQDDE